MGYFILDPATKLLLESEINHITRVLRMGPGSLIQCSDTQGNLYQAEISSVNPFSLKLINCQTIPRPKPSIRLILAIIKIPQLELVLQKITELGVDEILVTQTEYSQISLSTIHSKLKRFKNILVTAMKQSEQTSLPKLEIQPLSEIKYHSQEILYLASTQYLAKDTKHLLEYIPELTKLNNLQPISLLIGPEGGFSRAEYDLLLKQNFIPVRLGPHILRAETASIVGAGILTSLKSSS